MIGQLKSSNAPIGTKPIINRNVTTTPQCIDIHDTVTISNPTCSMPKTEESVKNANILENIKTLELKFVGNQPIYPKAKDVSIDCNLIAKIPFQNRNIDNKIGEKFEKAGVCIGNAIQAVPSEAYDAASIIGGGIACIPHPAAYFTGMSISYAASTLSGTKSYLDYHEGEISSQQAKNGIMLSVIGLNPVGGGPQAIARGFAALIYDTTSRY